MLSILAIFHSGLQPGQIGKFAECAGDLSFVQIVCAAAFVSLNNSSIVSFCCLTKILRLEPWLKFKVRGREIGHARQTFQSGSQAEFLKSADGISTSSSMCRPMNQWRVKQDAVWGCNRIKIRAAKLFPQYFVHFF